MTNQVCPYYFRTWLFSTKYVDKHNFSVPWVGEASSKKLNVNIFNNNLYVSFLKQEIDVFLFHVLYYPSYVWNLTIVSKNNIRWSRLAASSYSPLLMIKFDKTLDGYAEN